MEKPITWKRVSEGQGSPCSLWLCPPRWRTQRGEGWDATKPTVPSWYAQLEAVCSPQAVWMSFSEDAQKAPESSKLTSSYKAPLAAWRPSLGNDNSELHSTHSDHTSFLSSRLFPKPGGCRPPLRHCMLMPLPTLVLKGHFQTPAPSLPHTELVFFFIPLAFTNIKRAFSQIVTV